VGDAGLAASALVAGAVAVLSPCSVGLLPAYLGLLVGGPDRRRGRAAAAGFVTAAGILSFYALLCVALAAFTLVGWGDALRVHLPWLDLALAALLVAVGVASALRVDWSRFVAHPTGGEGFLAFGFAYGAAAFGCTGPAFLPILLLGFTHGFAAGMALFVLYAGTVAAVVVAIALFTAAGRHGPLSQLARRGYVLQRAGGLLMAGAGLYLAWFTLRGSV
ncbi:MAG: hypothetical protein ACYDBQ_12865, partial [Thermoplasmatota archaeon]